MSYPLQMLFIVLLAVLACGKVTLQGRASKGYIKNTSDSILFNGIFFAVIALCISIIFPKCAPSAGLVLFSVMCGAVTVLFQSMYAVALSVGPVSITVLIVNFSVLINTLASVLFFKENLYLTQIIGVGFLVASMILSVDRKGDHKEMTLGWLLLAVGASVSSGVASCLQKLLHTLPYGSAENADITFLIVMYAAASVFAVGTCLIRARVGKKEKSTYGFCLPVIGYAAAIGLLMSVYQKLYMHGLATIDGTFMFPTFAGLQSLGMTVIGVILFKDKLNKKQLAGVACGIACLVMMNIRLGWSI